MSTRKRSAEEGHILENLRHQLTESRHVAVEVATLTVPQATWRRLAREVGSELGRPVQTSLALGVLTATIGPAPELAAERAGPTPPHADDSPVSTAKADLKVEHERKPVRHGRIRTKRTVRVETERQPVEEAIPYLARAVYSMLAEDARREAAGEPPLYLPLAGSTQTPRGADGKSPLVSDALNRR